jgi:hypothetical protein
VAGTLAQPASRKASNGAAEAGRKTVMKWYTLSCCGGFQAGDYAWYLHKKKTAGVATGRSIMLLTTSGN